MGLYPVSPVDGVYIIGSPIFERVTIHLDARYYPGGTFTIITHHNSPRNIYIQSALLNGRPLERAWIRHSEIAAGGTLVFEMGPEPNKTWGSAPDQLPPAPFTME
jgi:putative alpha-1,2-mannosidase